MGKPLREVEQGNNHFNVFCTYNQGLDDLEQFKGDLGLEEDITGLVGFIENGEVEEMWGTFSNRPWELSATYYQIIKDGWRV